jgi:hypothetical protein
MFVPDTAVDTLVGPSPPSVTLKMFAADDTVTTPSKFLPLNENVNPPVVVPAVVLPSVNSTFTAYAVPFTPELVGKVNNVVGVEFVVITWAAYTSLDDPAATLWFITVDPNTATGAVIVRLPTDVMLDVVSDPRVTPPDPSRNTIVFAILAVV